MNMDRFKFRVWSVEEKSYDHKFPYNQLGIFYIAETGRLFSDFGNIVAPEMHQSKYIVEQCTGLKDKNGNLIYEGDVICDLGEIAGVCDEPFVVIWSDRCVSFMLDGKTGMRTHCASLDAADAHNYEIVGNKHEQKD